MRPPELCSKNRSGINSATRFTTVLLHFSLPFLEAGAWKVSLTSKSNSPSPAACGRGCDSTPLPSSVLEEHPNGKGTWGNATLCLMPWSEKQNFLSSPHHIGFSLYEGKKKKSYVNWSKCQFQDAAFLKIPSYTPLLGTQRCFTNTQRPASEPITPALKRNYCSRGKTSVKQAQAG